MDAVCFDMDGVVVDSETFWEPAERDRIYPEAVPGTDVDPAATTGMNYREIYDYLAERYAVALSREEFVALYDEVAAELYGERVELMDGLPALLEGLRDAGVAVALVSSSPHDWIGVVLDRFALREDFEAVVSAEDVDAPGKPEPFVYEHAASRIGVDPGDAVAVEDSRHGVAAAVAADMTAVGYRSASNRGVDLSAADLVVEAPDELREALLART
jgi:HAD superfamily hydrolase (TIGR01509 family)